jgi:amino-acid N-acetyltransferase
LDKPELILELIKPFVNEGKILPRSYKEIAENIDDFVFLMNSNELVASAGLRSCENDNIGEIYCMVVKDGHQNLGYSKDLLNKLIEKAKINNYSKIFALSKYSTNWFLKYGFTKVEIDELPKSRQKSYNFKRNSSIFVMNIL